MLKLNQSVDPRIAQNFPNDPYANLHIITTSHKFNLQLAFLAMDSDFFAQIDPDVREISLSNLAQEPLIKVLKALYGEQLNVSSVNELVELFPIIQYLKITAYKDAIEEQVKSKKEIMESIDFLQFAYRFNVLKEQVTQLHMVNKLRVLQDSKNYLQLNKITPDTFTSLTTQFSSICSESDWPILNTIMENYFNRIGIKAVSYFQSNNCNKLAQIWSKFHHMMSVDPMDRYGMVGGSQKDISSNQKDILKKISTSDNIQQKKIQLALLQKELNEKDNLIYQLELQILQFKKSKNKPQEKTLSTKSPFLISLDSENQSDDDISFMTTMKRTKKQRDNSEFSDLSDSTMNEHAFQGKRVIPQTKEFKSIGRVNSKNMKIF